MLLLPDNDALAPVLQLVELETIELRSKIPPNSAVRAGEPALSATVMLVSSQGFSDPA